MEKNHRDNDLIDVFPGIAIGRGFFALCFFQPPPLDDKLIAVGLMVTNITIACAYSLHSVNRVSKKVYKKLSFKEKFPPRVCTLLANCNVDTFFLWTKYRFPHRSRASRQNPAGGVRWLRKFQRI